MNTLQMKYFMELAACGSVMKAAGQMGVSRTSVTRNIRKLEEELGVGLFEHTMDGLILTRDGEICLRYARKLFKIDEDLRFDIAGSGSYHGSLNIAMGVSRTQNILMFVLPEFNCHYPNISVQIHELCTSDIYNWLLDSRLDFAIVSQREIPQGFSYEHLLTEHLVLVAPRDDPFIRKCRYEKKGKCYVDLKKFQNMPFILGYATQKSRSVSDWAFKHAGFTPRVILQTSNNFNAAMLAWNGLGYALVPESCTTREQSYIAHYYLEPEELVSWGIGITSLNKNPPSHAARQLELLICEMLGDGSRKSDGISERE